MQYPSSSQRLKPQRRSRVRCSETRSSISMWVGMGLGPRTAPLLRDAYRRLLDDPGTVEGNVRGHGSASVDSELDDAIVRPAARSPGPGPVGGPRAAPLLWRRARGLAAVGPDVRSGAVDARTSWPMTARRGDAGGAARVPTYPVDIGLRARSTGAARSGGGARGGAAAPTDLKIAARPSSGQVRQVPATGGSRTP